MLNDVRIGRLSPKDIEKVDVNINIKKIPLADLDESQNPMNSHRRNMRPQTTTNRSRNQERSMNKSVSESNLKSMVQTFFSYDLKSTCEPDRKFKDNISTKNVKSA